MGNYLAGFGGDSYDMYQDYDFVVVHGSVFYPIIFLFAIKYIINKIEEIV